MTGKKIVLAIIIFTIIVIFLTWLYLEFIIEEYDLDRAMSIEKVLNSKLSTIDLPVIIHKL